MVTGPESTGKSTLCKKLADYFKTEWVPEFAREYLLKNGAAYSFEDLLTIAKGQLALEDRYAAQLINKDIDTLVHAAKKEKVSLADSISPAILFSNLLFIDTDMYVMKVWSEFVFDKCHRFILDEIAARKYDLYLLTKPDLPWVKDELREYPDFKTREKLYCIYKDILINQNTPWVEISGGYEDRLQKAISAVNGLNN